MQLCILNDAASAQASTHGQLCTGKLSSALAPTGQQLPPEGSVGDQLESCVGQHPGKDVDHEVADIVASMLERICAHNEAAADASEDKLTCVR